MKVIYIIIGILILHLDAFSQVKIEFVFLNSCDSCEKLIQEFNLYPIDTNGLVIPERNNSLSKEVIVSKDTISENVRILYKNTRYLLKYYIDNKNYSCSIEEEIMLKDSTQKIIIKVPKIKVRKSKLENDLNSFERYSNYYFCNKICNGKYVDYYSNNKKRIEGEFKNGKPLSITTYNKYDSGKEKIEYIKETNLWHFYRRKRLELYDENGNLSYYKTYKHTRRCFIEKTYYSNNKLIKKQKYHK